MDPADGFGELTRRRIPRALVPVLADKDEVEEEEEEEEAGGEGEEEEEEAD